jgi:hypothetical protein
MRADLGPLATGTGLLLAGAVDVARNDAQTNASATLWAAAFIFLGAWLALEVQRTRRTRRPPDPPDDDGT